ncbi:MAG: phospholipid carrier-dependent glycosyltransferase [Thioploca sp.]|nr:phospholipid carrier-dependent glycosyltransferase [Thioploca sp.]
MQKNWQIDWLLWGSIWLLLVIIPLWSRPLLPIDETRYVSVAWEMWNRGNWLVPFLNGEVYYHKPPLLFWLIHWGWGIFGVNEWWPRLLPGLFSLGSLLLTRQLASQLWPKNPLISQYATWILLSCCWWSIFTSAVMFDMLLTFFTLLGLVALLKIGQKCSLSGWGLFGLALGLGILTKGPVMLLHLLPVAVLAPMWQSHRAYSWRFWYGGLLGSVVLGSLIALSWAIPASVAGGEEFRQAIFWGQTAHRLVNSFAHNHPVWWYFPLLPLLFFPWLFWLPWWRAWLQLPQHFHHEGVRFCLAWLLPVLTLLCLISGKQPHYLLPLFPAFALLSAYLLIQLSLEQQHRHGDTLLLSLIIILIALLLLVLHHWFVKYLAQGMTSINLITEISLLLLASVLLKWPIAYFRQRLILLISSVGILVSLIVPISLVRSAGLAYDLRELSNNISIIQNNTPTIAIANFGDYQGQYQFLGRLTRPLAVVDEYSICAWLIQHQDGKLIVYFDSAYQTLSGYSRYLQPYRSKSVGILDAPFLSSACVKIMPLP